MLHIILDRHNVISWLMPLLLLLRLQLGIVRPRGTHLGVASHVIISGTILRSPIIPSPHCIPIKTMIMC